jgi:hypothetical protein
MVLEGDPYIARAIGIPTRPNPAKPDENVCDQAQKLQLSAIFPLPIAQHGG